MRTKSIFSGIILLSFLLVSCGVSSKFGKEVNENAKNQLPPDGKSLVYVYRTSSFGFAIGLKVAVDNKTLASFYPKNFYLCTLDPGQYVFTGHAENKDEIIINAEPDKKYYIEVKPKMGLVIARIDLALTDEINGNKGVQKCKLVGMSNDSIKE